MMIINWTKRTYYTCYNIDGVMQELESSLGDIQIVKGVVSVQRSEGVTSLSFLRNLRIIAPNNSTLQNDR